MENKYGLSRYVPEAVRLEIRREAGYGCVICGSMFIQYEHIDPEFKDAKKHDPKKMTALCGSCHYKVTKKILPKEAVWAAKANPMPKKTGFLKERIFCDTSERKIQIAGCQLEFDSVAVVLNGWPMFWMESPLNPGEPPKICCIFYDRKGRKAAFINRNEFYFNLSDVDIESSASRVLLRCEGECLLTIDVQGGMPFNVLRMANNLAGQRFEWDQGKNPGLTYGGSCIGGITGGFRVKGATPFAFGRPIRQPFPGLGRYEVARMVSIDGLPLRSFQGDLLGWRLGDILVDRNYLVAGQADGDKVFNLLGDYSGTISGEFIGHDQLCFEDGEPIFIDGDFAGCRYALAKPSYDTSYKIFGLHPRHLMSFIAMA